MRKRTTQEPDGIGNLPSDITNLILLHLPIKDAIKTSILSTNWRYKWHSVPNLVFDDRCKWGTGNWQEIRENLGRAILRTLTTRTSPLKKFELSLTQYRAMEDINHSINHLSRVFVEEITLYIETRQYQIPTSLFNCQHLIHLKLHGCVVIIPHVFEGFKKLITLDLQRVKLFLDVVPSYKHTADQLEGLISCCPRLKYLTLRNIESLTHVKVNAPNLESLDIGGNYHDVAFGSVMEHLKSVTEHLSNSYGNRDLGSTNLHNFLRDIPSIQILKVESYSLKYLGLKKDLLPHALVHLECLFACINFNSKNEILTVMSLMRRSPKLKRIVFQGRVKERTTFELYGEKYGDTRETLAEFWNEDHWCCLEQVEIASVENISGSEPEQEFINFLLTSLPKAKTITIRFSVRSVEIIRNLMQLARAATQANVIILQPDDPEADQ